jgi:hypothetical protein
VTIAQQEVTRTRPAKVVALRPRVLSHIEAARYIGESPASLTAFTAEGRIVYHYSDPWSAAMSKRMHRRYFLTDLDRFLDERALASRQVHKTPKNKKLHDEKGSVRGAEVV